MARQHMRPSHERGAVILAGGEGTRLSGLTHRLTGRLIPKQFCHLFGGQTMLDLTRRRVGLRFPNDRLTTVVTRVHHEFYKTLLKDLSFGEFVIQPQNRGTAPAIIYALFRMSRVMPRGAIAIFPSDHWFSDDARLMAFIDGAFDALNSCPDQVLLLGIKPDRAEAQYGWIEAGDPLVRNRFTTGRILSVKRFWEKPSGAIADELYRRGCLWNSCIMVANIPTLLNLYAKTVPDLYTSFLRIRPTLGTIFEHRAVQLLYNRLQPTHFSESILETSPTSFAVLTVIGLEWTDLGTPDRLLRLLNRDTVSPEPQRHAERIHG